VLGDRTAYTQYPEAFTITMVTNGGFTPATDVNTERLHLQQQNIGVYNSALANKCVL